MSLKLYYTNAHTGGDKLLTELLQTHRPAILIVPETCTYAYELRLCSHFGALGFSDVEVLSFSRLCHRVLNDGPNATRPLVPAGKIMAISRIFSENKKNLSVLGSSGERIAPSLLTLFSEFKRYMVSTDALEKLTDKLPEGLLREKMRDVALLYSSYQDFLKDGYTDSDDDLIRLAHAIENDTYTKGRNIFVADFTSFTPDQALVLCALCKRAQVNILCPCDEYSSSPEHTSTQKSAAKLERLCYESGVEVTAHEQIKEQAPSHPSDLLHLFLNFFKINPEVYDKEPESISLFCANDRTSEITHVAECVLDLIKDGARLNDISVVCRDNTAYLPIIRDVFTSFDIPFYDNTKTVVSQHPVCLFLLSAVNVIISGFSYNSVFSYLKTGYSDLSDDEIDTLEDYVKASGIQGDAWKKPDKWNYTLGAYQERQFTQKDEQMLKKLDALRHTAIDPVLKLKDAISGRHTAEEFVSAMYTFTEDLHLYEKITNKAKELTDAGRMEEAALLARVTNAINDAFCALINVSGDEKLGMRRYFDALASGLSAIELTIVPPSADGLLCGTITRARGTCPKYVFLIGVNDGVFPQTPGATGLLSDADRLTLTANGLDLSPDSRTAVYEEQALVKSALTLTQKKLYISYPTVSADGTALRPSSVVTTIKKLFPALKEQTDMLDDNGKVKLYNAHGTYLPMLCALRSFYDGSEIDTKWLSVYGWYLQSDEWRDKAVRSISAFSDTYEAGTLRPDQTEKLFPKDFSTSISRLETYKGCPFRYFISYVLKAKEKTDASLDALSKGSLLHSVVERFCVGLTDASKPWSEVDDAYIDARLKEIFDECIPSLKTYLYTSSRRVQYQYVRLFNLCKKSIMLLRDHLNSGKFTPLGYEISFDENGTLAPIKIDLPGGSVRLRGKIDRADVYKSERGTFVRVIDYKSGHKAFDLPSIYAGLSLQLCVYLTALSESEKMIPSGMLYFRLDDPIIGTDEFDAGAIEHKRLQELKMSGVLLCDDEVLTAHGAPNPKSLIPARMGKDGFTGSLYTADEFKLLSAHVKKLSSRIAREMKSGNIAISPTVTKSGSSCDFCSYKSICQSCTNIKKIDISSMSKDEIMAAISAGLKEGDEHEVDG